MRNRLFYSKLAGLVASDSNPHQSGYSVTLEQREENEYLHSKNSVDIPLSV